MRRFGYFLVLILLAASAVAENVTAPLLSDSDGPIYAEQDDSKETGTKAIYNGFSGGMMLHVGYQAGRGAGFPEMGSNPAEETYLRSITYGIGGAARIQLIDHIHVGSEGYVSTMPLKSQGDDSNIRTGWGGVLCDYYFTLGRTQLIAGGSIGGGAQRNLHVFKEKETDISSATFAKKSFFVFDPYLAAEYALTTRIHLIFKLDYLIAIHQRSFLSPSGPRLYVGFMFGH